MAGQWAEPGRRMYFGANYSCKPVSINLLSFLRAFL